MTLFKTFFVVILAFCYSTADACMQADDVQIIEGTTGTFKLNSSCSKNYGFSYKATTVNGQAQSPDDFTAFSGVLYFTRDDRKEDVKVETIQDNMCEQFEKFTLKLSDLKVRVWRNGVAVYITPNNNFYNSTTFKRSYEFKGEILQSAWIDSDGNSQCT